MTDPVGGPGTGRGTVVLTFVLAALFVVGLGLLPGRTFGATDILFLGDPFRAMDPSVFPGNLLQNDQVEQLPFVVEFWSGLRNGDLQLWEPDVAGGVPLFTGVHNRVLAPWNVAFLLLPAALAAPVAVALALVVAQSGTYLLARRLGQRRDAAVVAAVVYALSGTSLALVYRINELFLFPLLLYVLLGLVQSGRARARWAWVAATGVVTAAVLVCGFPAAALFCLYAAAVWVAYLLLWVTVGEPLVQRLRSLVVLGTGPVLGVLAGAAMSAVQLLPTLEFLRASEALERSYPIDTGPGLAGLATAVSARFYGTFQGMDRVEGTANPVEVSITIGLAALLMVCVALARAHHAGDDRTRPLWGVLVPMGFLVLLAGYLGGVVLRLVQVLPYMDSNTFNRARFISVLVLALVAGLGVDLATRRDTTREAPTRATRAGQAWLAATLALVGLGVYVGVTEVVVKGAMWLTARAMVVPLLMLGVAAAWWWSQRRWPSRAASSALVVAAAVAVELVWGSWGFTPTPAAATFYPPVDGALAATSGELGPGGSSRFIGLPYETIRPNAAALYDVRDMRAAFPAHEDWRSLVRAVDPTAYDDKRLKPRFQGDDFDLASPVLDAMAVGHVLAGMDAAPIDAGEPVDVPVTIEPGGRSFRYDLERWPQDEPVRAMEVPVVVAGCEDRGRVTLSDGSVTTQHSVRRVADTTTFVVPDVTLDQDSTWTIGVVAGGEGCAAHLDLDRPVVRLRPRRDGGTTRLLAVDGLAVYSRETARARVELATSIEVVPDAGARIAAMGAPRPAGAVVARDDLGTGRLHGGTASILRDDPDVVTVEVASRGPGLLVLRDVLAPGWRARVDGEEVEVHSVDQAFRGVLVPGGTSQVEFFYRPRSLELGALLALLGLLGVAAAAAAGRPGRRD